MFNVIASDYLSWYLVGLLEYQKHCYQRVREKERENREVILTEAIV